MKRLRAVIPVLVILLWQGSSGLFANEQPSAQTSRRIACVGDSITYGANIGNRERDSYPSVLQREFGGRYEVRNFGVSGANLIKKGDKPYWREAAFMEATTYEPDIVIIMLGTNDTKPQNWRFQEDFPGDLRALIGHFTALRSKPKIWLCTPPPVYQSRWGINQPTLDKVLPMIRQVAKQEQIPVIDVFAQLSNHPDYFADGIHPNEQGAAVIAKTVCGEINLVAARRN